jgi:hypothetical protein
MRLYGARTSSVIELGSTTEVNVKFFWAARLVSQTVAARTNGA